MSRSIVVVEPGQPARVVSQPEGLRLEEIERLLKCDALDARLIGDYEAGKIAMWVDDNGLLNDAVPNRRAPNGWFLCGAFLVCGIEGEDDVGLPDELAEKVRADVEARWPALPADAEKPKPEWKVTTW